MAKADTPDERAMVAHDKEALEQALKSIKSKKQKTPGDRQIEERLADMTGAGDLGNPQRYHGS
jgi:hypothetical protein